MVNMVTFKGTGSVWIPKKRCFVRFVSGEYSTDKTDEIDVLKSRYSFTGDIHENVLTPAKEEEKKPRGRRKNGRNN